MSNDSIGWDAYLDREWAWHCHEQEVYALGQHIEELEEELRNLEEQILDAEAEERHDDARALEIQYDAVRDELDSLTNR